MLRKIISVFLCLTLCFSTIACGSTATNQVGQTRTAPSSKPAALNSQISDGKYPIQQASYDDGDGIYTLMLLNTPPGTPPLYRSANIQMARLTEEAIANGEKTYLEVKNNQPVMYLTEDFNIEYVHSVVETQTNPQTGQPQTVVVRQQSNFWSPFAGALAGQAIGSLLFSPRYYVPPVYTPGTTLRGYGGAGSTYGGAVESYQAKHNSPPPAVKNRQVLRTSGSAKRSPSGITTTTRTPGKTKASGGGFGSSNLNTPRTYSPTRTSPSSRSFGSSRRVGARRR
ncbi:hypothetical protein [Gloeocapsa sp. PCC 73106]|uniref:hypothetical protein n=1 Tax=Gloeocapsa sp. PCC 73106 TaxID=102232 RepID=UPI0002AC60DB|nr:hypothetical protein [Gloeocapsa sp. PCC 73106]ELS00153.1 hypothetical protein GLO73106DRAFT_00040080 [Gloeocapsa sp. PCC 73106]